MKRHFITLFLALTAATVSAQYQLEKGKSQLNGGTGLSTQGLSFYLGSDYGYKKDISFGVALSYFQNQKIIMHGISANGNYHLGTFLGVPKNVDIYGGLNLGFFQKQQGMLKSFKWNTGIQAGARYYFLKNMAINLEVGSGNAFSTYKFGLTYMLK